MYIQASDHLGTEPATGLENLFSRKQTLSTQLGVCFNTVLFLKVLVFSFVWERKREGVIGASKVREKPLTDCLLPTRYLGSNSQRRHVP